MSFVFITQSLLELYATGEKHEDSHLTHFLDLMLEEQVDTTKKIGDYITQCKKVGPGLGEFEFDRYFLDLYK
jgi:ferritin heavy chain